MPGGFTYSHNINNILCTKYKTYYSNIRSNKLVTVHE